MSLFAPAGGAGAQPSVLHWPWVTSQKEHTAETEQSAPLHPVAHSHSPSTHRPRAEHESGHVGTTTLQSAPA